MKMIFAAVLALSMMGSLAFGADAAKQPAKEDAPPPMATDKMVALLAKSCPVADPGDQAAFETCRKALFESDVPGSVLARRIFWGAPVGDYAAWRLPLTAFDQGVFANLYLPLFMFSGEVTVERKNGDSFNIVHVPAAFRNRLQPGQFPYPFWHKPEKWAAYEATNELQFYIDTGEDKVWYVLRANTPGGKPLLVKAQPVTPPAFDGKWLWTDAKGMTQPAVTLFDGLLSAGNPNKEALEVTFKAFAQEMRGQTCLSCHVPDNPKKMSPLVLLQTPAHALGEIKRIQNMVTSGQMPLEEWGAPKPLSEADKAKFLAAAKAFGDAGALALGWEKTKGAAPVVK